MMPASVWRGRIAFGMVSIPVRLYKAARRERIRFHHVYRPEPALPGEPPPAPPRSGQVREFPRSTAPEPLPVEPPEPPAVARVRHLPIEEQSHRPLEKARVLKGYEIEKDRYVTFEPQELAALRPQTSTEMTIGEFVRIEEIDPVFFETSYYAAPDEGGEKPYALLFEALRQTGYAAMGSVAMHGREHAALIRAGRRGLLVHRLFYENEVRADEEYRSQADLVAAKELELAKTLVWALAAPFDASKLKDVFEERLRQLVDARAHTAVDAYERGGPSPHAPVVDITEALRKTLEMVRKPPASEAPKPARRRQRRS